MATIDELAKDHARLIYYLRIEGLGVRYGTNAVQLHIFTRKPDWSEGSDYQFVDGLEVPKAWTQTIEAWGGVAKGGNMTFEVTDFLQSNGKGFFAEMFATHRWDTDPSAYPQTLLTAQPAPDATTLTVESTTNFPDTNESDRLIWVGNEAIVFTAKTGGTFTGCSRGRFTPNGTSPSSGEATYVHRVSANNDATQTLVTWLPWGLFNRRVALWITHQNDDGSYGTEADAYLAWQGYITDVEASQTDQRWRLSCSSLLSALDRNACAGLGGDDFVEQRGTTTVRGYGFSSGLDIYTLFTGRATDEVTTTTFSAGSWQETQADVANSIQADLPSHSEPASTIEFSYYPQSPTYELTRSRFNLAASGGTAQLAIWPFPQLLGFAPSEGTTWIFRESQVFTNNAEWAASERAPSAGLFIRDRDPTCGIRFQDPDAMDAAGVMGDSATYPALMIGDTLIAYYKAANTITISDFNLRDYGGNRMHPETTKTVVQGPEDEPIPIKQVFAPAAVDGDGELTIPRLYLRLMLSTTGAGKNGLYDDYNTGIGMEIPESCVDVNSFLDIATQRSTFYRKRYYVFKDAFNFRQWLDDEMKFLGGAVVMKNGKITWQPVPTGLDSSTTGLVTLNEDNKAKTEDHSSSTLSPVTVVNQIDLEWGHDARENKYLRKLSLIDPISQQEFRTTRAISLKNMGIQDLSDIAPVRVTKLFAGRQGLYRSPTWSIKRTINRTLHTKLVPGQTVIVNDGTPPTVGIPDPWSGDRGIANRAGVVLSVQENYATAAGSVDVLLFSENNSTATGGGTQGPLSPSALVNFSRGDNGWESGTKRVHVSDWFATANQHEALYFNEGDKIILIQIDSTTPEGSPQVIAGTVATGGGYWESGDPDVHYIPIDEDITGSFDTGRLYMVAFADYGTATSSQRTRGSWACHSTGIITGSASVYYKWSD